MFKGRMGVWARFEMDGDRGRRGRRWWVWEWCRGSRAARWGVRPRADQLRRVARIEAEGAAGSSS